MEIFKHYINRQITAGRLPEERLIAVVDYDDWTINFKEEAKNGLQLTDDNQRIVINCLMKLHNEFHKLGEKYDKIYNSDIAATINLQAKVNEISRTKAYSKGCDLKPVVTNLDKTLYGFVTELYLKDGKSQSINEKKYRDSYVWSYLLLLLQEKELKYKKNMI